MSCASDAIRYCKDPTTCKDVRVFFDAYLPKIVSILLDELEDGTLPEVKPRIKTLLGQVLEVVSTDLTEAAESKRKCKMLTILTSIFDEVTGYQESDILDLVEKFVDANGLENLDDYFWNCIYTGFPSFGEIISILNFLELAVKGDGKPKCTYALMLTGFAEDIISHLLSYTEEQLLRHGDDSVDICKRLSAIVLKTKTYPMVSDYFNLLRDFVFKLISSSAIPLKLLGYEALHWMNEINDTTFPPPRAYLIQGAGKDIVNGRYELWNINRIIENGYVLGNVNIVYTRTVPTSESQSDRVKGAGRRLKLFKNPNNKYWYIYLDDEKCYINYDVEAKLPPSSRWESYCWDGDRSLLTLSPIGLIVPRGKELSTVANDFWHWMHENDVLELVAQDSGSSNRDIQQEAIKAGHSMIHFTGEMLDRVTKIIQEQSKPSQILCDGVAKVFTEAIETLLFLDEEAFKNIIPDFMMKTCDQLRAIVEYISLMNRQHMFDYLVFRRLLLLRLMITTGSTMAEVEAIPGAKLMNSPPETYQV